MNCTRHSSFTGAYLGRVRVRVRARARARARVRVRIRVRIRVRVRVMAVHGLCHAGRGDEGHVERDLG